jgi:hypothetical protein
MSGAEQLIDSRRVTQLLSQYLVYDRGVLEGPRLAPILSPSPFSVPFTTSHGLPYNQDVETVPSPGDMFA